MSPEAEASYVPGEAFHADPAARVYAEPLGRAVNKRHAAMAKVVYEPAHRNDAETDPVRRGRGRDYATWVFSEEPGTAEGLFETGLELVMDARFEPHAAIGLHRHTRTEEVYYMLEGALTMTTIDEDGATHTQALGVGDAHAVRIGQAHYGEAGPEGARVMVVAVGRT